jgi:hypothetical protein
MKWTSYLLGGLGQPLDSHHHEQELRLLRRSLTGERLVHRNQDANIEALWQENHELKIYLRALIHLLTSKRVLSGDEIAAMVKTIERSAESDARPPVIVPGGPGDTSPDLQELRKAVEETEGQEQL